MSVVGPQWQDAGVERAAIIVAGGAARRMGGVAKPWLEIAGRPMIEHIIADVLPKVDHCVVVGVPPGGWLVPHGVRVTVETPAGGGPKAAVAAALLLLPATVQEVLLLSGDAPFVAGAVDALLAEPLHHEALAVRDGGRTQYLCSRVNRTALSAALVGGDASMRSVFDLLQIDTVDAEVSDADTWEDMARLRASNGATVTDNAWLTEVADIIGADPTIDVDAVLALTRDVAHNVERKNAPLSAYYLGFAAAARGLNQAQIAELAAIIGGRAKDFGAAHE